MPLIYSLFSKVLQDSIC